jgi:hypothetical protein
LITVPTDAGCDGALGTRKPFLDRDCGEFAGTRFSLMGIGILQEPAQGVGGYRQSRYVFHAVFLRCFALKRAVFRCFLFGSLCLRKVPQKTAGNSGKQQKTAAHFSGNDIRTLAHYQRLCRPNACDRKIFA